MKLLNQLGILLPQACKYVSKHESIILESGHPLSPDQMIDAHTIGIKNIEAIRVMKVGRIPLPFDSMLQTAAKFTNLISPGTIGIAFRYGIYIQENYWNNRRLTVHELTHTLQYERLGGIRPFLKQYLDECLTVGYHSSPLELEAREMERVVCG